MPKQIIKKTSTTPEQILQDLLAYTVGANGCLEWVGAKATDGYPVMYGNVKVHRKVASLFYDKDLTGIVVRHTCDNPKCINPNHLLLGTHADNMEDRKERGRYKQVITKDIVVKVRALLDTKVLYQKEIADLVGIDIRRVSDINVGLYDLDGKFLKKK